MLCVLFFVFVSGQLLVALRHFDVMSFASKVTGYVTYGFAAGCEAVAMPRRHLPVYFRGYAPRVSFALYLLGQRPHQGHSPKLKSTRMAGQSHRLTSGGKAELNMPE